MASEKVSVLDLASVPAMVAAMAATLAVLRAGGVDTGDSATLTAALGGDDVKAFSDSAVRVRAVVLRLAEEIHRDVAPFAGAPIPTDSDISTALMFIGLVGSTRIRIIRED